VNGTNELASDLRIVQAERLYLLQRCIFKAWGIRFIMLLAIIYSVIF